MCQISADAKNQNLTFENLSGALDLTVCQVWIYSGEAKLVFLQLDFCEGLKLKCVPNFSWCKK